MDEMLPAILYRDQSYESKMVSAAQLSQLAQDSVETNDSFMSQNPNWTRRWDKELSDFLASN